MVSFVSDLNSLDPSFSDQPNPLSDIPSLADDIKMLSEKLGEVFGQEGATVLGRMDSLSTRLTNNVHDFWGVCTKHSPRRTLRNANTGATSKTTQEAQSSCQTGSKQRSPSRQHESTDQSGSGNSQADGGGDASNNESKDSTVTPHATNCVIQEQN